MAANASDKNLTLSRVFNAPRDLVFKTLTEENRLKQWWGPEGFTCPAFKTDSRVGGKWLACMRSDQGEEMWSTGVYKDFKSPERIVTTDAFADKSGKIVPASTFGMPGDWPLECMIHLTLTEEAGKTRLQLVHEGIPPEMMEDCRQGWQSSWNKLEAALKTSL